MKRLLLTNFCVVCISLLSAQSIDINALQAEWLYNYSMDSSEFGWTSFLATDEDLMADFIAGPTDLAEIPAENEEEAAIDENPYAQQDPILAQLEAAEYIQNGLPLLLKTKAFTLRISPSYEGNGVLKVNYLEYPKDASNQYAYTDRTVGYIALTTYTKYDNTYIELKKNDRIETCQILQLTNNNLILLDTSGKKHLFKRKI